MFQFLVNNENKLKKIVDLFKADEIQYSKTPDSKLTALERDANVKFCTRNFKFNYKDYNDVVFLNMFVFIGYGYGIAYSDKNNPESPYCYHQSPMTEWYKIKDNWFYFEYFD